MGQVSVFVIDGHDVSLYPDAQAAAREIEGYDAERLVYFGVDGCIYRATVEGREWGPVTLHRTDDNRLDELVRLLRSEAVSRGLSLPLGTPDDPEVIWAALLTAQTERRAKQGSERRPQRKQRPTTPSPME